MQEAWGAVYVGAGPGDAVAARFLAKYWEDIYRAPTLQLGDITAEELGRFLRRAGTAAPGLDGFWAAPDAFGGRCWPSSGIEPALARVSVADASSFGYMGRSSKPSTA